MSIISTTAPGTGTSLQAGEGVRDVQHAPVQEKLPGEDAAWQAAAGGHASLRASVLRGRFEECFGSLSSTLTRAVNVQKYVNHASKSRDIKGQRFRARIEHGSA